jgi:formylglycine-generating enzyme required for sulfatase activity
MTLAQGSVLNQRYRVVSLLGEGGFGAVYRVWDLNLERPLALKENLATSIEAQRQFKREAQILFDLSHPNLPRVIDLFVVADQGQYLVMEFVEGQDLEEMLEQRGKPLPLEKALEWTGQICDALDYLHRQQPPIIHRDIKPANIRITRSSTAMLVDFGIAKLYDADSKTTQGAQAVTPGYSPLEQYGRGHTDARSDVYALGATLYTLLTNQLPPASVDRLARSVGELKPASELNSAVPQGVSQAIEQSMSLECDARFSSAAAFKRALTRGRSFLVSTGLSAPAKVSASVAPRNAAQAGPAEAVPGTVKVSEPAEPAPKPRVGSVAPARKASPLPAAQKRGQSLSRILLPVLAGGILLLAAAVVSISALFGLLRRSGQRADDRALLDAVPTAAPANLLDKRKVPMALIPAGEFLMGSERGQPDERPGHTVYLDEFYIDQYEVTNSRYEACVKDGACEPPAFSSSLERPDVLFWKGYYGSELYDRFPVVYVDWYMAKAYCEWRGARLPTEAEWEKAARGDLDGKQYPWGDADPTCEQANYANCVAETSPVGSFDPNAYGLYDMAGNVSEWVADWYAENYYELSPTENPVGPMDGEYHVVRGGAFNSGEPEIRVSYRNAVGGVGTLYSLGFRCVRPGDE